MSGTRRGSRSNDHSLWTTLIAAALSGLVAAVIGGVVGGLFAIRAVEREADAGRETAALELRREALDEYVQAYTGARVLTGSIFREADDISNGAIPADQSLMATTGGWRPGSYRITSSGFPEVQALEKASARLSVLFSPEIAECADRISDSLRIHYWEMSALATKGTFEWFTSKGQKPSWREEDTFSGLFGQLRGRLYETLIDLARAETNLEPLKDAAQNSARACSEMPYYIADSSTECSDPVQKCLDLTDERWSLVLSGNYDLTDFD